jgi:hypothetical protein
MGKPVVFTATEEQWNDGLENNTVSSRRKRPGLEDE